MATVCAGRGLADRRDGQVTGAGKFDDPALNQYPVPLHNGHLLAGGSELLAHVFQFKHLGGKQIRLVRRVELRSRIFEDL